MTMEGLDLSTDTKALPACPEAPTKEEILANTSEMDEVAPLKPTKVIKMRRQTLRKRAATAANRLAGGRSTRDWDVHGNSAKNLSKLEELVAGSSKDMNAAEASMRLVAMMSGDVVEQTASRLRKSFGDLVDEELLRVLRTEPEARTEYDVDVVERHVSWHSIFKDLKPLMRRKMCRALKCAEYDYGDIIVVQGDAAESFCIVYQGEVSVHCWRERSEVKLMLRERPSGSIARNKGELMEEAPYVIGGRVGVLRQGNSFGENGMDPSGTAKRSATCVSASSRTILLELCRHDLMGHPITSSSIKPPSRALLETLKVPPSDRTESNVAAIDDAVGGHPFFSSLSKETRLSLVQNLTVEAFRKDRAVVLQDDRADAFYVVFSGDVDVFISDATKPLKEWKKVVLASRVDLLKKEISSFELEERRRLLRERHARECAERDYMAIEALKSAGMEYEHVETVDEYIEENPAVYTLDLPLPERLVGRKVATLSQGAAFGENGLHTSINFRAATVVASSDRVLLLKLSREDVQTDVFDSKEEDSDEEEEPALDCNFEPVNVAPLRRLSLKKSVGPVSVPVKAEEPTPPTTGRRTSLLSMFTPCPREATIHVTLQRRKRRGTVSPVKKLARARALDKALND